MVSVPASNASRTGTGGLTMQVELTARQVKVSKALRTQAEEGMDRIARILGRTTSASVIFRVQRHLQIAELTVKARLQTIVAAGQADSMESAQYGPCPPRLGYATP